MKIRNFILKFIEFSIKVLKISRSIISSIDLGIDSNNSTTNNNNNNK